MDVALQKAARDANEVFKAFGSPQRPGPFERWQIAVYNQKQETDFYLDDITFYREMPDDLKKGPEKRGKKR
jgi:hypothetical protein